MQYEPITRERLEAYYKNLRYYVGLIYRKFNYQKKLHGINSVDFSKERLTGGNRQRLSPQEHYVLRLEKINKKIKDLRAELIPERDIIQTQLNRLTDPLYKEILIERYMKRKRWTDIMAFYYDDQPDFEEEEGEDLKQHGKYWDKIMNYHAQAVKQIEKISEIPYVSVKQLKIGVQQ